LRPALAAQHASPAPLRLALTPSAGGLTVDILKRRGPACAQSLFVVFDSAAKRGMVSNPIAAPVPASVAAPTSVSISASDAEARVQTELFDHVSMDRRLSEQSTA